MLPRKFNTEHLLRGSFIRTKFDNDSVYLFPRDPARTVAVGDIVKEFGPPWPRGSTGIVLEARDDGWVKILVPGGGMGWIGSWNIALVE